MSGGRRALEMRVRMWETRCARAQRKALEAEAAARRARCHAIETDLRRWEAIRALAAWVDHRRNLDLPQGLAE